MKIPKEMEKVIREAKDIQALKNLVFNMFEVVDVCSECNKCKISFKMHDYDCGLLCSDCLDEFKEQEESQNVNTQNYNNSLI